MTVVNRRPSLAMAPLPSVASTLACAVLLLLPSHLVSAGLNIAYAFAPNVQHRAAATHPLRLERTVHPHPARRSAAWTRHHAPTSAAYSTGGCDATSTSSSTSLSSSPIMEAYECDASGRNHMDCGALNAAVKAFSEAARYHPTAERHLRLGMALEENGEPRKAIESYESARYATDDPEMRKFLALKLAHVWADDLGDVDRALSWSDAAMEDQGGVVSAEALDRKAVFLAATGDLKGALALWDEALEREDELDDKVDDARFFRGVARERVGLKEGSVADLGSIPPGKAFMVDSWNYISLHPPMYDRLFSGTYTHLADAVAASRPDMGLVCEFGVFHGKSIRLLAEMLGPDVKLDGFDTFEGIPEAWGDEEAGTYTAAAEIPENVPDNVKFHVGLFADTLPGYVTSLPPAEEMPVRLINVDCDLYQGTVEIFQYLAPRIGPGTIIVFDEYLMHPTWPEDEYKAFQEACTKYGWKYQYLNYSLVSKQAAVRITSSDSFVGPLPPWLAATC